MNLNQTSQLLNSLLSQTSKKRDKKVYNCFIRMLSSLKKKDLNENQLLLIQEKLSSFNLETPTINKRKFYKQKLSEFMDFLKTEFYFTKEKYYTEIGMVYGMSLGTAIGLSIGVAINPVLGLSIGLSIGTGVGMVFGMIYGVRKDAEAKKRGLVL